MKGLLEYLGLDVIVPPPTTKRTLSLGMQHGPEFACLPLKINIGNLIEAKELGADAFIMAGGLGPCRFGLYAQLEKEILEDLGYKYEVLVLEPPQGGIGQFLRRIKEVIGPVSWWKLFKGIRFAYRKTCLVDQLEKMVQEIRPREDAKGTADKVFNYALQTIDRARSWDEAEEAYSLAKQKLLHIPGDETADVLKIGIVGEIYTLLEPFASLEIEKKLGYLGAHVTRSIYFSDWINDNLFRGLLGRNHQKEFIKCAGTYLNHFVGGHGQESIGAGVAFSRQGYDGIVQIAPFTCMPEIVAHTVFSRVSEEQGIPVMTVYVDEHSGQEGINTRLEAFIDLLNQKRMRRKPEKALLDRRETMC